MERAARQGRPQEIDEWPDRRGKRTTNHPLQGGPIVAVEEKSRAGSEPGKKMLINGERSQYMYENKQKDDILTTAKGENFA
jgi:hypothetical protein